MHDFLMILGGFAVGGILVFAALVINFMGMRW